MSLQDAFNEFNSGCWADGDVNICLCSGHGWALSDFDTWHRCPIHYRGQLEPEDYYTGEDDESRRLREEISMQQYEEEQRQRQTNVRQVSRILTSRQSKDVQDAEKERRERESIIEDDILLDEIAAEEDDYFLDEIPF